MYDGITHKHKNGLFKLFSTKHISAVRLRHFSFKLLTHTHIHTHLNKIYKNVHIYEK